MSESTDAAPAEPDAAAIGYAVLASGMEEMFAAVQAEFAVLSRVLQSSPATSHAALPAPPAVTAKPVPIDAPQNAISDAPTRAAEPQGGVQDRSVAMPESVPVTPGAATPRDAAQQVTAPVEHEGVRAPAAPVALEAAFQPRELDPGAPMLPPGSPLPTLLPVPSPDVTPWELPQPVPTTPVAQGFADGPARPDFAGPPELPWPEPSPAPGVPPMAMPMKAWPVGRAVTPMPPPMRPAGVGSEPPWPGTVMAPEWPPPPQQLAPVAPTGAPDMATMGPQGAASVHPAAARRNTTHQHHDSSDRSAPLHGDVFLDGMRVGHWLAETLAREAGGPAAGSTSFDPRLGPRWPGALQGQ